MAFSMNKPGGPPQSSGKPPEDPSSRSSRAPSIPPTPGQPGHKEDPLITRAVDSFLLGFDRLAQETQNAKLAELKKNNPRLHMAVQFRLTRIRAQEALTHLESSTSSGSRIRTAVEIHPPAPEVAGRQSTTAASIQQALKTPGKK